MTISISTHLARRKFLVATGVAFAQATLAADPVRAQLVAQGATTRRLSKVGVAPGYIVSGRGEHLSNPYFLPQGKPSSRHMPPPPAVHGKGVMEEGAP
jgi:hypothetical protein